MEAHARPRVLVVDDCECNRKFIGAILAHRQVAFDEAADGQEALSKLDTQEFDLVLMDVQMPIMDGFDATAQFRLKWPNRNVPIVAVTASTGDLRKEVYRKAGFTSKMEKPFAVADIYSLLSQYSIST